MKNPFKNISSWSSELKAGVALSLGAVIIFTSAICLNNNKIKVSSSNNPTSSVSNNNGGTSKTTASNPIVDVMEEELIKPYLGSPSIKRYFYSSDDPIEIKAKSIVKLETTSTYVKSVGIDYAYDDGKEFGVVSSLSGKVTERMNDPTYGNILVIEHKSGLKLYYASIDKMKVNKGDEVKQGDVIAYSSTSVYTKELKSCLHFEVMKDNKHLNPEKLYSSSVRDI